MEFRGKDSWDKPSQGRESQGRITGRVNPVKINPTRENLMKNGHLLQETIIKVNQTLGKNVMS